MWGYCDINIYSSWGLRMAIPFYFSGLCFLQKLARFHECFHNWLLWNWAVIIDFCTFGLLPNSLNHLWSNRHRFKCLMYIDLFSLDLSAASFLFVHRIWTNFIDLSRKHEHEHLCTTRWSAARAWSMTVSFPVTVLSATVRYGTFHSSPVTSGDFQFSMARQKINTLSILNLFTRKLSKRSIAH